MRRFSSVVVLVILAVSSACGGDDTSAATADAQAGDANPIDGSIDGAAADADAATDSPTDGPRPDAGDGAVRLNGGLDTAGQPQGTTVRLVRGGFEVGARQCAGGVCLRGGMVP